MIRVCQKKENAVVVANEGQTEIKIEYNQENQNREEGNM